MARVRLRKKNRTVRIVAIDAIRKKQDEFFLAAARFRGRARKAGRFDLMVRFNGNLSLRVDLCVGEYAACSCNIRRVVPNEGSGFTGCANRVRRPSNNEIDDEAAGKPTGLPAVP